MSVRPLVRLSVAMIVALSLVACGGDDSSGAGDTTTTTADGDETTTTTGNAATAAEDAGEQAYVDAALQGFDAETEGMSEDDARCIVTSVVTTVGVPRLQDLGISPEEFNDADIPPLEAVEADKVVDSMEDCIDLRGLMVAGLTEDSEPSQETTDCLEAAIDDDLAHRLMVATISSDDASAYTSLLTDAIDECPGFENLN